jgi:hypothetical protein
MSLGASQAPGAMTGNHTILERMESSDPQRDLNKSVITKSPRGKVNDISRIGGNEMD